MFDPVSAVKALDPRFNFRSAVTGQYVSRLFAALHPNETVKERK